MKEKKVKENIYLLLLNRLHVPDFLMQYFRTTVYYEHGYRMHPGLHNRKYFILIKTLWWSKEAEGFMSLASVIRGSASVLGVLG